MARSFNGGTDQISVAQAAFLNAQQVTSYACWLYLIATSGSGDAFISELWNDSNSVTSYSMIFRIGDGAAGNAKRMGGAYRDAATNNFTWAAGNTDIVLSTWTHLGWVSDGVNINFYLNGVLDKQAAMAGVPQVLQRAPVLAHAAGAANRPLVGYMADCVYYPGYGLSRGEMKELSQGGDPLRVRPERLAAYFPLTGAGTRENAYGRMGAPLATLMTLTGTTGAAFPYGGQQSRQREGIL